MKQRPEATLRHWIAEREAIRRRRAAGRPFPWTEDPVLRDNRFTNVSRRFDRMTVVLARDLGATPRPNDKVLSVVLFRAFNRLSTWEALRDMRTLARWRSGEALRRLRALDAAGEKICSGVWMVGADEGRRAYECQLEAPAAAAASVPCGGWRGSLAAAFAYLEGLPRIGPFVANEMVMDLAYLTPLLDGAPDRKTFVRLGPGSVRGLRRLRGADPGTGLEQPRPTDDDWGTFAELRESLARRPPVAGLRLTVHDVEHCLCEFDKYARGREGGHLKNRYRPGAA